MNLWKWYFVSFSITFLTILAHYFTTKNDALYSAEIDGEEKKGLLFFSFLLLSAVPFWNLWMTFCALSIMWIEFYEWVKSLFSSKKKGE